MDGGFLHTRDELLIPRSGIKRTCFYVPVHTHRELVDVSTAKFGVKKKFSIIGAMPDGSRILVNAWGPKAESVDRALHSDTVYALIIGDTAGDRFKAPNNYELENYFVDVSVSLPPGAQVHKITVDNSFLSRFKVCCFFFNVFESLTNVNRVYSPLKRG